MTSFLPNDSVKGFIATGTPQTGWTSHFGFLGWEPKVDWNKKTTPVLLNNREDLVNFITQIMSCYDVQNANLWAQSLVTTCYDPLQ